MKILKARMRRTVVVTLLGGDSFRGVLWEDDRRNLVLRDAVALIEAGEVKADGELVFGWDRVAYIQFP